VNLIFVPSLYFGDDAARFYSALGWGNTSMVPLVRSRQLVIVAPVDPGIVEVGDVVLARVSGTTYLHLVSAVDHRAGRVQISNNRGRVNGWTPYAKVYGICTTVDGLARPRLNGKLRPLD
jgi:hypothetical protein